MGFTLKIETTNAAFEDCAAGEIARNLGELAEFLDDVQPGDRGNLHDTNGNTVGTWSLD